MSKNQGCGLFGQFDFELGLVLYTKNGADRNSKVAQFFSFAIVHGDSCYSLFLCVFHGQIPLKASEC